MEQSILHVHLKDDLLFDRIHELSKEYNISVDILVRLAVQRFVNDIDFIRKLRSIEYSDAL